MQDKVLGFCGLYCGGCAYYQNTINGVGTPWEGQNIDCFGCNSGQATPWCTNCEIKACNERQGIRICLDCTSFPCEVLTGFMDDPRYPYHKDVPDNMKRLKEIGLEAWSAEQEKNWICADCGGQINWSNKECPACKSQE